MDSTKFSHSIVLFCGDDGLPLEFNIRNIKEKSHLKALIEHGGGICSQESNAIHLINPGTKILNADLGKKLLSSKFIFDCVEQNYLLSDKDYHYVLSEAHTSDISEDSGNSILLQPVTIKPIDLISENPEPAETAFNFSPKLFSTCQNSTSSESFVEDSIKESVQKQVSITVDRLPYDDENKGAPSTSIIVEKHHPKLTIASEGFSCDGDDDDDCRPFASTSKLVDKEMELTCLELSPIFGAEKTDKLPTVELIECDEQSEITAKKTVISEIPAQTVVSSSQPEEESPDEFDKMLLDKSLQHHDRQEEESLSQSYTVSSSADAQASKSGSIEPHSNEVFAVDSSPPLPNDQTEDIDTYFQNLESDVLQILQKPSPKSIKDKICLVKYICAVKKLPPATVLESLHNL